MMLKSGQLSVTVPLSVPPPMLVMVSVRSAKLPSVTVPKLSGLGDTWQAGAPDCPVPMHVSTGHEPPVLMTHSLQDALPGVKRIRMDADCPAPRLYDEVPMMLNAGQLSVTVPLSAPPPPLVMVKLLSTKLPIATI